MSCQFMCVCEDRGRSCLSLTAAIEAFSGLFSFCYFCRFNSYFPLTPTVSCFLNYYLIFKDLIFSVFVREILTAGMVSLRAGPVGDVSIFCAGRSFRGMPRQSMFMMYIDLNHCRAACVFNIFIRYILIR